MKNKTKKFSILFSFLLVLGIIFVMVFNNPFFVSSVSALPSVVTPDLRTAEIDDFDNDATNVSPSEPFYSYSGDYNTDNATYTLTPVYGYDTFFGNESLNLSGIAGSSGTFEFNESDYFSIDYYLFMTSGTLEFLFYDGSDLSFKIEYVYTFNASRYVSALDLDDDGHVNCFDLAEIYAHYGQTGSPGWIKSDLNWNGIVNYLDASYFISHYVSSDTIEVNYYTAFYYNGSLFDLNGNIFSYTPVWEINGCSMLHSYFQFSLRNDTTLAFNGAFNDGSGWVTWDNFYNGLIGYCDWNDLMIRSDTDTVGYLDNLSVCYTPYPLSITSFYPSDGSSIDLGLNRTIDFSVTCDMGNDGEVPMFVTVGNYLYDSGTGWNSGFGYYGGNEFILLLDGVSVYNSNNTWDYISSYRYYINITTSEFYFGIKTYSWEFPQSGNHVGNKYYNIFNTEPYKAPYVTSWYPANNATGVSLLSKKQVTVHSHYGYDGQIELFTFNNVTKVWMQSGITAFTDGQTVVFNDTIFTYNTDVYWYVSVMDYGNTEVWEEYPNATQNGRYVYGHKAWKFKTEPNYPPVVKSFSPANNSKINPWLDTIYVNMSSMNAGEYLSFYFFIIENEQWYNASHSPPIYYEDTISMLVNNNSRLDGVGCGTGHKYYTPVNGSINFTWTPQDMVDVGYLYPRNNTCFSWRVVMLDEDNTVYYPLTGRLFEGLKWINYTVDLEQGNKLPTVTINYPLGGSYTKGQWRKNHDLSVTLNDLEGDNIRLLMTVRSGDVNYVNNLMLDPSGSYLNTAFNPYITPYFANGTYIIDLSPYIPFDNTEYEIIITATDDYIYHYGLSGNTAYVALEIGTPPGKQYHLAFMGFNPPNGELNGVSATSQVTGYLALNKMSSPPKYASGDGYQIGVFFADGNAINSDPTGNSVGYNFYQLLLSGKGTKWRWGWTTTSKILISPITGLPYVDFNIVAGDFPLPTAQYFTSLNIKDNDTITPWTKISLTPSLVSRHPYKMWIGLYTGLTFSGIGTSTDIYGNEFANYQIFPEDEIEIDNLYDDSLASCPDFRFDSYVLQNVLLNARHIATPPYKFGEGDYSFCGMSSDFSTYNTYDNPELFIYNLDIPNVIEDAGIGFGGIIIALLIIGLSAICPYILIKRKARTVPMPIVASFTLFGFILSYGMGLIPIYAFVIVLFIIFIMIIYKAIAYITGKVQSASDDGVK
jgi:hypothetical protein